MTSIDLVTPILPKTDLPNPEIPTSKKISCIVPVYNEAANLTSFIPALTDTIKQCGMTCEIIAIDDGSRDESLAVLQQLLADYPLTILQLSRNFGKESALTAGIEQASGDCALLIDADFQHPLSAIATMVDLWKNGYDMVYGIRDRSAEGWLKHGLTHTFYWLINAMSEVDMPMDAGDFRLMDAKVIAVLKSLPERTRYMKGLYAWVGFKSIGIHFQVQPRKHGKSSFNWLGLFRLAVSGITAFSDTPLRFALWVGSIVSVLSLGYGIFELISTLVVGNEVAGWTTLVVILTFLGGIQLMFIGILGEYLGRIYNEVKARPKYVVANRYTHQTPDNNE